MLTLSRTCEWDSDMHDTTQAIYSLTNNCHEEPLLSEQELFDLRRYRWLANQLRSGALVLHTDTLGVLKLWADSTNFEAQIDQAIRTQDAIKAWREQIQVLRQG